MRAALVVGVVLLCGTASPSTYVHAQEPRSDAEGPQAGPAAELASDLRELLVDLSASRVCRRLDGKLMALSGKGASTGGAPDPTMGVLWVRRCSASEVAPEKVRIELAGKGWRWLSRETSKAAATFEVDQYVRFSVDVSLVGSPDLAYDADDHVLTAWLVPTEPVQADIRPIGGIEVDTASLWADIVGAAASLTGRSPGARAEQRVAEQGGERFERALGEGFTVALDLCTGRQATHLGTLPEGKMPPIPLDPKGQLQKGSGRARLHDGGLSLFGPFESPGAVVGRVAMRSDGAVEARLVCEEQARRLHEAYLEGTELPQVDALAAQIVRSQAPIDLEVSDPPCLVVLVLQPEQGTPVTAEWAVFDPGRGFEPVVSCP